MEVMDNPGRLADVVNDAEAGPVIAELWNIIQREGGGGS